jgi:hypothetical protein
MSRSTIGAALAEFEAEYDPAHHNLLAALLDRFVQQDAFEDDPARAIQHMFKDLLDWPMQRAWRRARETLEAAEPPSAA